MIFLINQLKKDASKLMFLRKGFLVGPSNVMQHLNPACQAARSVPDLGLARLPYSEKLSTIILLIHAVHVS